MFDKIQQWPSPVTAENWRDIKVSDIWDTPSHGQPTPQLQGFLKVLGYVENGIRACEDTRVYEGWQFNLPFNDLLNIWVDLLTRLKETSQQQPGWLQQGSWTFNGTQVGPWQATYDPASAGFLINTDPYLLNDLSKQQDFGLIYEIGRDLNKLGTLIRGGVNSALTKAALSKIDDRASAAAGKLDKHREQIKSELDSATADRISEIKTVQASKDWSDHFESRCAELTKTIEGEDKKVMWGQITVKNWGLKKARSYWYRALFITFIIYAVVALMLITGHGLRISKSLDATLTGFGKYFIGLTLYGVLAGVYIGYAYSVRQLKVHQNLLEQYRHRSIVAKTIESVVLAVIKSKEGSEESALRAEDLDQLVKVAAESMFEYRPIGHLSTKEGSSFLGDLLGRNTS